MQRLLILFFSLLLTLTSQAQIVSLNPSNAGPDDAVTLTFDASEGNAELEGFSKVYMHHGVVTTSPTGTTWSNVIGNWGEDNGVGQMTAVDGQPNKWQITFSPSVRAYFGVTAGTDIFRICGVFRSADGAVKGTIANGNYGWGSVSNGDFFINLNVSNYISINAPSGSESYLNSGDSVRISATASASVSSMKVWIDEGTGFEAKDSVATGTSITYYYKTAATKLINIKITATIGGEEVLAEKAHNVVIKKSTSIVDLPAGVRKGINYLEGDTSVTLVLEAPEKDYAYVVGDFNNWNVADEYQMNQTTDGEFLWLTINGLTPQQEYVFQYWVDGTAKIGDPYAEKIADPWNDQHIPASVYPNLPVYTKTEYQTATVLQTGQTEYVWSSTENTWVRPELDNLVIYELLVRDFIGTHSYSTLMDTLNYLKRLGVEAIELMPFSEFEGNESWGYNPSYYFAPDKYYGPKDSLKHFIETAHQMGFAVIMDMVLNHAFGQNAMVKLYWDNAAGKPAANNPWFNRDLPANHYGWGSDFDHTSDYTKAFIDSVNRYWIQEYHIDGYRFDYTKGFTNSTSPDSYDATRIDILKRMVDSIWAVDPDSYIILEHWGPSNEETELANYGMKLWRNKSYDYVPAMIGNATTGSFNGMQQNSHVAYFNSHDERRLAEHALSEGLISTDGSYNVKDPLVMFERKKLAAAFTYLFPGPKMIWQFDELAYDIDINFNGRVGNKPLPWGPDGLGYYEDENRQYVYDAYSGILNLRNEIGAENLASATVNHKYNTVTRRLSYDFGSEGLVVIGNFGLTDNTVDPAFPQTGTWYNYFSGEEVNITNASDLITLKAGEWHIFTTTRYSDGMPGVVEVYENPVTVNPYPFTRDTEITITFDATKASNDGTAGLVGASKVYMHAGVVTTGKDDTELSHLIGNLNDDGVGLMTEVSEDIWEITLTPEDYFDVTAGESIYSIGMYFRDASNTNLGKGFRNSLVYAKVQSSEPFITVNPASFANTTPITITFNANQGNGELAAESYIYMHSGIVTTASGTTWENVVGTWGADNGVGKMNPVAGKPGYFSISFTPATYYGTAASDSIYWIAAVFRNKSETKGTGTPGVYDFGYIHSGGEHNGDYYIKNQADTNEISVDDNYMDKPAVISLYPNPANEYINLGATNMRYAAIYSIAGQLVKEQIIDGPADNTIDISALKPGVYVVRTRDNENNSYVGKFMKIK